MILPLLYLQILATVICEKSITWRSSGSTCVTPQKANIPQQQAVLAQRASYTHENGIHQMNCPQMTSAAIIVQYNKFLSAEN